jgi:hypothetical protein
MNSHLCSSRPVRFLSLNSHILDRAFSCIHTWVAHFPGDLTGCSSVCHSDDGAATITVKTFATIQSDDGSTYFASPGFQLVRVRGWFLACCWLLTGSCFQLRRWYAAGSASVRLPLASRQDGWQLLPVLLLAPCQWLVPGLKLGTDRPLFHAVTGMKRIKVKLADHRSCQSTTAYQ